MEEGGQKGRQPYVTAKGKDIRDIEYPRVLLKDDLKVTAHLLLFTVRGFLREKEHEEPGYYHEEDGIAVNALPAVANGKGRGEKGCDYGAAVACPCDSYGQTLILRREPPPPEGKGDTEACTGYPEYDTHDEDLSLGVDEEVPVTKTYDDLAHLNKGRVPPPYVLGQKPQGETHEGPGDNRDRNHETLLGRGQTEFLENERSHGPVHHPDGKTEIKVQKGYEKRWGMPGL